MSPLTILGILNVTPDSFSDGGEFLDPARAIAHGLSLVGAGADWVDVGGESTRPGATSPTPAEERSRVMPVINGLCRQNCSVSVDTRRADIASEAIDAGATLVNDVSGMTDPAMRKLCARAKCRVCIMHMRGEPATMQDNPVYHDVVQEVETFLLAQATLCLQDGIQAEQILLDPGIGFGKTLDHNLALLRSITRLGSHGYPILIGLSRKGFLGKLTSAACSVGQRLGPTLAGELYAVQQGACAIRTHDVAALRAAHETDQALRETEFVQSDL